MGETPILSRTAVSRTAESADRINEAGDHGWLGEVDGLQTSLAATGKLTNLDRISTRPARAEPTSAYRPWRSMMPAMAMPNTCSGSHAEVAVTS